MSKYQKTIRHGDMVLFKLNPEAEQAFKNEKRRNVEKVIVGLGEVTGHSHDVVCDENATINVISNNEKLDEMTNEEIATMDKLIFEISNGGAVITHDEHDVISLEEGTWMRSFQVEYNPFKEEVDKVKD